MAGIPSDKPVEEEEVPTEEADPTKTTDEEKRAEKATPVKSVEEEEVQTKKVDLAKTAEEEVKTEETDPAKTTDEEVRTEKVDLAKTTDEEVRTEEAIKPVLDIDLNTPVLDVDLNNPVLDIDLNNPVLDHNIEDKDSDEGNENENPQEDSTMIFRSNQTRKRGLTSSASDENRRLAPQNRFGAQVVMPQENVRLSGSLVTQPPYQNPRLNQIPPNDQMMNQQQQFLRAVAASVQNLFNQPLNMQQQRFPSWLITDLSFAPGFVPNNAAWRPQIIRPLMPNENAYQQHPMVNQLASIPRLQNQMFYSRPLFVASELYLRQQPHLSATAQFTTYPYMRPEANHQNLRMPGLRNGQVLTLISPNGQPRSFYLMSNIANPQVTDVFPLDDAVVVVPLPELNHQQMQQRQPQTQQPTQSQRFNAGPFSHQGQDRQQQVNHQASSNAPAPWPELNHQRIQQGQLQTQQPTQGRFNTGPFSHQGQDQQQQFNHQASSNAPAPWPELNHQRMQQGQLQTQQPTQGRFNTGPFSHQSQDQQQQFNHQASSNAPAPWHELNHQQMQQRQPQTQQPRQSRRFNAGPYSHQGQDQQQQP